MTLTIPLEQGDTLLSYDGTEGSAFAGVTITIVHRAKAGRTHVELAGAADAVEQLHEHFVAMLKEKHSSDFGAVLGLAAIGDGQRRSWFVVRGERDVVQRSFVDALNSYAVRSVVVSGTVST